MWSTTMMNDNMIVNLSVMASIVFEFDAEDTFYKIWAYPPCGNNRYLLLESDNEETSKNVFKKIKKELMQAEPIRICYQKEEAI